MFSYSLWVNFYAAPCRICTEERLEQMQYTYLLYVNVLLHFIIHLLFTCK